MGIFLPHLVLKTFKNCTGIPFCKHKKVVFYHRSYEIMLFCFFRTVLESDRNSQHSTKQSLHVEAFNILLCQLDKQLNAKFSLTLWRKRWIKDKLCLDWLLVTASRQTTCNDIIWGCQNIDPILKAKDMWRTRQTSQWLQLWASPSLCPPPFPHSLHRDRKLWGLLAMLHLLPGQRVNKTSCRPHAGLGMVMFKSMLDLSALSFKRAGSCWESLGVV